MDTVLYNELKNMEKIGDYLKHDDLNSLPQEIVKDLYTGLSDGVMRRTFLANGILFLHDNTTVKAVDINGNVLDSIAITTNQSNSSFFKVSYDKSILAFATWVSSVSIYVYTFNFNTKKFSTGGSYAITSSIALYGICGINVGDAIYLKLYNNGSTKYTMLKMPIDANGVLNGAITLLGGGYNYNPSSIPNDIVKYNGVYYITVPTNYVYEVNGTDADLVAFMASPNTNLGMINIGLILFGVASGRYLIGKPYNLAGGYSVLYIIDMSNLTYTMYYPQEKMLYSMYNGTDSATSLATNQTDCWKVTFKGKNYLVSVFHNIMSSLGYVGTRVQIVDLNTPNTNSYCFTVNLPLDVIYTAVANGTTNPAPIGILSDGATVEIVSAAYYTGGTATDFGAKAFDITNLVQEVHTLCGY